MQGDVLELSAGTGRNFKYYKYPKLRSLTVADLSQEMLHRWVVVVVDGWMGRQASTMSGSRHACVCCTGYVHVHRSWGWEGNLACCSAQVSRCPTFLPRAAPFCSL